MKLLGGEWSKGDVLALIGLMIGVVGIIVAHRDVDPKPALPPPQAATEIKPTAPTLSAAEVVEIQAAKSGVRRLRLTVEPIREARDVALNGVLTVTDTGVSYGCPEFGCPDGTVGDATSVLVGGPFFFVQRPNNLSALQRPGFQQYLLLEQLVFSQFQQTLRRIEDNTVPKRTEDYRPILEHGQSKCHLDSSAVDDALGRLSRLRGLEDNSLFWSGDPGAPFMLTRFRVSNPERLPLFGHFLISIGEAAGLTYGKTDTISVREMTALVADEYRNAHRSLLGFEKACDVLIASASAPSGSH